MATHTLGTNASSSLTALKLKPAVSALAANIASASDVAQIDGLIADDKALMNAGVIGTGTLSSGSNTITGVSIATGLFGQIKQGQWIYAPGIPGGTGVLSASGNSIVMTNTATANGSVTFFVVGRRLPGSFSYNQMLFVPNRGWLTILPGDAVGVDASGWPVLVSAEALAYSASSWTFT